MARRKKFVSLSEALDMIFNDSDNEAVDDIYITPPNENDLTEEDSADEDCGGTADNLSRNQLLSEVEVVYSKGSTEVKDEKSCRNEDSVTRSENTSKRKKK